MPQASLKRQVLFQDPSDHGNAGGWLEVDISSMLLSKMFRSWPGAKPEREACDIFKEILKSAGGRLEADINSMPFSSILGLHLDRHEAEVAGIINAASKELTIELELKKLNEVWREQRLEVFKYTRGGTEERGLILRGAAPDLVVC